MEPKQYRTAIVFGATGVIGRAVALKLAQNNWNVAVHCLHNSTKAESIADGIRACGRESVVVQGNTGDEKEVVRMLEEVNTQLGSIDGFVDLVFPDRSFRSCRVENMDWSEWEEPLNSLHSYFNMCKHAVPYMRKKGFGRIVYISGGLAYRFYDGCTVFSTIKAGLNAFSKTLAIETGSDGITVNIVSPGKVIDLKKREYAKFEQDDVSRCPLGRFASPEDVADAVNFFFSQDGDFVTGQTLYVSGGEIMPMP